MRVALRSLGAGLRARAAGKGWRSVGWLTLAGGAALLAGCVAPSYPAYPTQLYLPPPYVAQPPYPAQPPVSAVQPSPVPLYPAPRQDAAPAPEISVDTNPDLAQEPAPDPPEPVPEAADPAPSAAQAPEPVTPPPSSQAGPGADAPLQGFRPMRGQSRPGL